MQPSATAPSRTDIAREAALRQSHPHSRRSPEGHGSGALRGLPGRQIGEALAEVDAHCADSGQAPGQAFGEPAGYAAARSRASGPDGRKRVSPLRAALKAKVQVLDRRMR